MPSTEFPSPSSEAPGSPIPAPQLETQKIIESVRGMFTVTQEYFRENEALEFYLDENQSDIKAKFQALISEVRDSGYTAVLRRTQEHGLLLMIFKKPNYPIQKLSTTMILLIATVITVFADGAIRAFYTSDPISHPSGLSDAMLIAVLYTVSLLGIVAIHEMGHKVAAWYHKMRSSWPYFIPGIPGIWPTMGAVIRAPEPPVNRDSLFDLGLSGPIAGLIVTFVVSFLAVASARVVPISQLPPNISLTQSTDFYTSFLVGLMKTSSANYAVGGATFDLLYLAYSFGFLITFINLLPAWQLDGGHITNSAVSPRVHQILTYISVIIMVIIGFYLMAFLVLLMANRTPSLRPLDDVSPLSRLRKVFFILTWVLSGALYVLTLNGNANFGLQPILHF